MSSQEGVKEIVRSILRDQPLPGSQDVDAWVNLYLHVIGSRVLTPFEIRQSLTEGKRFGWSLLSQKGIARHEEAFAKVTYEKAIEGILRAFREAYRAGSHDIPWNKIPPHPTLQSVELYPEVDDPRFHETLYWKREFHHKKSDFRGKTPETMCNPERPFELFPYQKFLRNLFSPLTPYQGLLLFHMPGSGKCHALNTPILMHDGTIKRVQDVRVGDYLMGDDSTPRRVLSLARGTDAMYDIIPHRGDTYRVNQEHILCLKAPNVILKHHAATNKYMVWYFHQARARTFVKFFSNEADAVAFQTQMKERVFEIPVNRLLQYQSSHRNNLKGYRVGVDFPSQAVPFDPYTMGLWIHNGYPGTTRIAVQESDTEIVNYLEATLAPLNLVLTPLTTPGLYQINKTSSVAFNHFYNVLRDYGLLDATFVLPAYLVNHRAVRLAFLAGVLDAGGTVVDGTRYRTVAPNEQVAKDLLYLCRSLGFDAFLDATTPNAIDISGEGLDEIPVKVARSSVTPVTDPTAGLSNLVVKYVGQGDYYGFTLDGNSRYLLGDFTVTHNTCTAITIAEQFRTIMASNTGPQRRALVLAPGKPILQNFINQLHSETKAKDEVRLGLPQGSLQCTGNLYPDPEANFHEDFYELKTQQAFKNQYLELRKNVLRYLPSDDKELMQEKVNEEIRRNFSNRIIIVDEVHKLKLTKTDEDTTPQDPANANYKPYTALLEILQTAENVRVVLLTATPVFDNIVDVVDIFNLLLANEGQPLLQPKDIFSRWGEDEMEWEFKPGGKEILAKVAQRYVSYVRGENPVTFPRIVEITDPEVRRELPHLQDYVPKITRNFIKGQIIPPSQRLTKQLVLVYCPMSHFEYEHLEDTLRSISRAAAVMSDHSSGIGNNTPAGSLIVFPNGSSSREGFYQCFKKVREKGPQGEYQFEYVAAHRGFLRDIAKYSAKYSMLLKTFVHGRGIHFASPQFNEAGVYTIAMLLEENGFENFFKTPYLVGIRIPAEKKQCALCSRKAGEHHGEGIDHPFTQAKYAIFDRETVNAAQDYHEQILSMVRRKNNLHGELLKVILGSPVTNEGVDFANIRHVHVLSPWWNLSRTAQIIGRAARSCSHILLPEKERRVVVYRYCAAPPVDETVDRETPDEWMWRKALIKDRMIKHVERILKENSIDCYLNKELNMSAFDAKKQSGQRACEYHPCEYTCHFEPKGKRPLNTDTEARVIEHDQIRQATYYISQLFLKKDVYLLEEIEAEIARMDPQMEKNWIYAALDSLISHMMGHGNGTTLRDQYGREGFIQYVRQHYVFLPMPFSHQPRTPLHVRRSVQLPSPAKVELATPNEYRVGVKESAGQPWNRWTDKSAAWWKTYVAERRPGEVHRTLEQAPMPVRIALVEYAIEESWFPPVFVSFFRFEWIHRLHGEEDVLGWNHVHGTSTLAGHLLGDQPRCYHRKEKKWVFCAPMLRKLNEHRARILQEETLDLHLAYVDEAGVLKLVDRDVQKKSDRIEGKTCKSFRLQRLHEIRKALGFPPSDLHNALDHCEDLEVLFRERQIEWDHQNASVRCFYQYKQWEHVRQQQRKGNKLNKK